MILENCLSDLDFTPDGVLAAAVDRLGILVVSDVNTNFCNLDLDITTKPGNSFDYLLIVLLRKEFFSIFVIKFIFNIVDSTARCRWSTNPLEPLLYIKYDWNHLNILDIEKKALTLRVPTQLYRPASCETIL